MTLVFLLLGLAAQSASSGALQHVQAGLEARKAHQVDLEIAEFRKATEMDPDLADAFVNLGAAYMEKHDYGAAITPLKRSLELSPDLPVAHQLLGYALLSQGYAAEAIPHLRVADAKEALGIAQIQTGELSAAVDNFSAVLAQRPGDPDLLYYLGHSTGLLSKNAIDTLIATHPESARAHQALAENYFVLRQMPQAESEYKEALRLRPELPGLHLELGQVYANSGQWSKAEDEFRAEAKLQPGNAEAAYRFGLALLQQGKAGAAVPELKHANELKPDMPETLYSLGKAASLTGDVVTAEKAWNRVIELEKNSSLAAQSHFGLAALYRKQGKATQAQHEMEEFQKLQSAIAPTRSE
jgi:tetratricopeptide (TPR) repeat protein